MAQPEFVRPDFLDDSSVEDIHQRMMANLPADIDDTPGGYAYDFTRPTATEQAELREFYLVRIIMAMFPQYAWDELLDLHAQQVHLTRHQATYAKGYIVITGEPGTEIDAGSIFATPAVGSLDSVEFLTDEDCIIGEDGTVTVAVTADEPGAASNVPAGAVTLADDPDEDIESITNPEPMEGGADEEDDDSLWDRIAEEYANSNTYLGNDSDYIRWAKEAGAGGCTVDPCWDGPGTVKLVLVDTNGQPASDELVQAVYDYIVSDDDRMKRLLPTGCAKLTVTAATTIYVNFTITGLQYESTTDIYQIQRAFAKAVAEVFPKAIEQKLLRYNDVRPLIKGLSGVTDFETFLMNGSMANISLHTDEYPAVGTLDFS